MRSKTNGEGGAIVDDHNNDYHVDERVEDHGGDDECIADGVDDYEYAANDDEYGDDGVADDCVNDDASDLYGIVID
jgi:hypothetical protein